MERVAALDHRLALLRRSLTLLQALPDDDPKIERLVTAILITKEDRRHQVARIAVRVPRARRPKDAATDALHALADAYPEFDDLRV